MKTARLLTLFAALLLVPACGSEAGASSDAAGIAGQITKLLTGVTDKASAEAAKDELGTLTDKFGTALAALKSGAAEKANDATGGAADMVKKAADAFSPALTKAFSGIKDQITRLLGVADISSVIGPTLEKLKGLLPS